MIELMVDALAVHRLSRLVTSDFLTQGPRVRLVEWAYRNEDRSSVRSDLGGARYERRQGDCGEAVLALVHEDSCPPKLAQLVTCMFCASVWFGAGAVAARRFAPGLWGPLARGLALSSAAIMVTRWEER